ncbi:MAG: tripartite tricarboxylate transporter substrate binding protein [Alphaproteobacteria bacterium]|nr:tripartite tricarboxylate transporter substrate binding protein [Alphaproteobacteria bacterium]
MTMRGRILALCLGGLCLTQADHAAAEWPERPVTSIVSFAAGGGADIALRALANYIKDYLGQPFLTVNKPGGGSSAAGLELLSKPADGYTVASLVSAGAVPEVYRYFQEVPYTSKDLEPVSRITVFPFGLYVNASASWKTLAEFVKDAKGSPGKFAYAHTGRGVQMHLTGAALIDAERLNIREVPTKGAAEVLQFLLGKHVDAGFGSTTSAKKYVDAGEIRVLGVSGDKRVSFLPDAPTFKEQGYDFGLPPLYLTMFVRTGTPAAIVEKLRVAVQETLDDPRYIELAQKAGVEVESADLTTVRKELQAEEKVVAPLLKRLNLYKE